MKKTNSRGVIQVRILHMYNDLNSTSSILHLLWKAIRALQNSYFSKLCGKKIIYYCNIILVI